MSRIRTIKPELLDDDKAAELPHQAWRLMVSVFVLADDHGRIRASIRYLAANVFSGDREGVEEARERLCRDRFWILYRVNGEEYALIRTFRLHQRIDNAGRPRLPGPDEADEPVDLSGVPAEDPRATARTVYLLHAPSIGRLKIGETFNLEARLRSLRSEMPGAADLQLVGTIDGRDSDVHARFAAFRLARQDGLPAPTEWFEDRPEIRAFFAEVK